MAQIGDLLKDIWYLIVYGLPYEEYKEHKNMIDEKREHEHAEKAKTFGEELHEIATPIYEERARRSKEEAEKSRKEWEANFNHSAKVVFDIMKDAFVKEANNGYFYYDILLEDIKDMLIAKQVYYYREKDLLEALNRVGQTMGIEVSSYELTKYHVDESGERKEDGYNTWVKFKW